MDILLYAGGFVAFMFLYGSMNRTGKGYMRVDKELKKHSNIRRNISNKEGFF